MRPPSLSEIARDPGQSIDRRARALSSLCEAEDSSVHALVVEELGKPELSPAWEGLLIDAAEALHFADEALRALLKDALALRIDRLLAAGTEGAVLWAAVRRYGTLLSAGEGEALLRFLDPGREIATQQVALQTLEHLMLLPAVPAAAATPSLREATTAFLMHLLMLLPADRSAEQDALLLNALSASAALGDVRAIEAARRFVVQADRLFHRLVSRRIEALTSSLQARAQEGGAHAEQAAPCAEALLEVLRSAGS